MRKSVAALCCAVVIVGATCLASCDAKVNLPSGENLILSAEIDVSENQGKRGNLSDGSDSVWSAKNEGAYIEINFGQAREFNTVVIKEPSDKVKKFEIQISDESGAYKSIYEQDRIDKYRMCALEDCKSEKIRIVLDEFDKSVKIAEVEVYNIKGRRQNFVRQAYYSNPTDGEGVSEIQRKKDDADYIATMNSVSDIILIGAVSLKSDATFDYGESLKKDIETLKAMTDGKLNVHATIMTSLMSDNFDANQRAIVAVAEKKLDVFGKNISELVISLGLDGVDFDWEYPQLPHQWQAYSDILIASKAAIQGRQLSVALWPYGINLTKEARAVIDKVNIMAYDQFDERGDHSSIYECGLKTIEYFSGKGFNKNQLLLGIPFYGRTSDERAYWPPYTHEYGKFGNVERGHAYSDADGTHVSDVYLNGYAMVRDKTALAMAYDLAGVMIFQYTGNDDYSYPYSLFRAVEEVVDTRIAA